MPGRKKCPRCLIRRPAVHDKAGNFRSRSPELVQTDPNSVAWYGEEVDGYVATVPGHLRASG